MNKLTLLKLGSTVATAALFVASVTPAFASTNVTSQGNGAFSWTSVSVNNNTNTAVVQTNSTNVVNSVSTQSDTGKNSASFNTGGSTVINTGGVTTNTNVETNAGDNVSVMTPPSMPSTTKVTVQGNGAFTGTSVGVNNNWNTLVSQAASCSVGNFIHTGSSTGKNSSLFNVKGSNTVNSGQVMTNSNVMTNCGGNGASN